MPEARNAARLHHPHAIAVFDVVGSEDEEPWIVMEYLPSQSLLGRDRRERADGTGPGSADRRFHRIGAGRRTQRAGLAHRDIKPGNVLIGHDGRTSHDHSFGINRSTGDGTMTDTGMIPGISAYLAPEVARGEQPDASPTSRPAVATIYSAIEAQFRLRTE